MKCHYRKDLIHVPSDKATISAISLVKRLMAKYDDVLSISDVIEELDAMERGEVTIETVCD